jgi:hypothetical protein
MIDEKLITKLREHAVQVKETCQGMRGSVTFHLGKPGQEPQVELRACDVTKVKR